MGSNVADGSTTDFDTRLGHFCCAPENGHRLARSTRPKSAKTGSHSEPRISVLDIRRGGFEWRLSGRSANGLTVAKYSAVILKRHIRPCGNEIASSRFQHDLKLLGIPMKKLAFAAWIIAASTVNAIAADLPTRYAKAPPIAALPYNWTGFYAGVNAGVGLGSDKTTVNVVPGPPGEVTRLSPLGGVVGAQIGHNWQAGNFGLGNMVFGVETDIQSMSLKDDWGCSLGLLNCNRLGQYTQKLGWFGTVRGRLGLATGPVLTYITGGFAYGGVETSFNSPAFGGTTSFSGTRVGWTFGSGVEAALAGNWTGKIEWLYVNLGSQSGTGELLNFPASSFSSDIRENIFRVGLNYRINGSSAYVPEPVANWTGFYIGGNAGAAIARNASTIALSGSPPPPAQFFLDPAGLIGGGQIGYNWQTANWVLGLEADLQGSTQRDNKPCLFTCNFQSLNFDQKMSWFGTVRVRLGYSVGASLFYATGGLAYGDVKTEVVAITPLPPATTYTTSHTKTGYAIGAGVETPVNLFGWFGKNWTSKTEYLFVDLGRTTDVLGINGFNYSTRVQEHIFRTGLNYHFNSPVVAKY